MGRKRKRSRAASPVKFSKKVVIAILAEVTAFTVAMIVVYMKTGGTPDTLIVSFFSFIGGEAGVLGLIRYGDSKYPKQDANTSTDAGASTGSGSVTAEEFLTVFTVVIAFYFGTQAEKSANKAA